MVERGEIDDGKTVLLLQWAALQRDPDRTPVRPARRPARQTGARRERCRWRRRAGRRGGVDAGSVGRGQGRGARRVDRRAGGGRRARRLGRGRRQDRAARGRSVAPVRQDARRRPAVQPGLRARQPRQAQRRARPRTDDGKAAALDLLDAADVFVTNVRARSAGAPRPRRRDAARPQPAARVRPHHRLRPRRTGRRQGGVRHRRVLVAAGIAHLLTAPGGKLPFQRGGMGDHNTGSTFAGGICAALVQPGAHRPGPARVDVAVPPGRLHGRLRPQHGARLGAPPGHRHPRDDGAARRSTTTAPAAGATSGSSASTASGTGRRSPASPGHPEWLDDPRFATALDRAMHAAELIALLDEAWATKTLDEWAPLFDAEPDMFWSRVQDPFEVVNDPHVPRRRRHRRRPRRRRHDPDDRHPGRLLRHPVVAARPRPRARRAHRGDPPRARPLTFPTPIVRSAEDSLGSPAA